MDEVAYTDAKGQQTTTINRRWLTKMLIFILGLTGLGIWGAYDAFVLYPARGWKSVDFAKQAYLDAAQQVNRLNSFDVSVEDPAATLRELDQASGGESELQLRRHEWLTALSRVTSLSKEAERNRAELEKRENQSGYEPQPTRTLIVQPRAELQTLEQENQSKSRPKPLEAYDIPVQYVIMVAGFGGALWVLFATLNSMRRTFRYDPAEHKLTLPDGRSIVPADIEDVDKRKWHKFFVFLHLKDGSEEIKLDLLKYVPLEAWILEMEKLTDSYEPPEDDENRTDGDSKPDEPSSDSTSDETPES